MYWIATGLFSAFMLFSAFGYLTDPMFVEAFAYLGYPDYFRIQLAVAKSIGAVVLLLPMLPKAVRGFTYAGFTINILSAAIAHLAKNEPISSLGLIFIAALLLAVSYIFNPSSTSNSTK